jgi:hypothetical protein
LIIPNLPEKGLKEGPWVFERKGIYYLTFPHVENKTERLEYAVSDHPMGPFEMKGVIMDESPTGCWTNHHSIIEYNKQWYLFYHHNDLSPDFDKNRSVRADSLFFGTDGSIQKVVPTLRGVGLTSATSKIETDRYSAISARGTKVEFIDSSNVFDGWKTVLESSGAWVQYDAVDFGKQKVKKVRVKASSVKGGSLQIRMDDPAGQLLGEIKVPAGASWSILEAGVSKRPKGVQNLVVLSNAPDAVEVDWLRFE